MSIDLQTPCPAPFNLAAYVLAAGARAPEKTALEVLGDNPQIWSYARLTRAVRGVASGLLDAGLTSGDIVLLRLGNTADFPIAYLGAIAAGMIAVPTSSALTKPEITKMAQGIRPAAVLQDSGLAAPDLDDARTIPLETLRRFYDLPPAPWHLGDPERPAYIVFTSGTSGTPRGVIHAHRAIWARRMMHEGWYDLHENDRLLHAGAFNWTFTLGTGLMDPWTIGATALIPEDGTAPEALPELLVAHRASLFAAAPGVFRKLLRCDLPELPALRHALSAGEKMPAALHEDWQQSTGLRAYEAFGMSECSTFISSSPTSPVDRSALGRAQAGRKTALLDEYGAPVAQGKIGTIAVHKSDAGLMLGYFGAPEETKARFQGDWFVTGDLGRQDETGAIHFEGRGDDMMNAGGFRLSPIEVESVFQGVHGIEHCAAIEVTLKQGVQVIALCYSAQSDVQESTLQALATQRLARYKQPRIYHHSDTLPTSANGKLLRRVLRSQIEAQYGQA
ncbi:MAG: class I adenylate-forming enzyme family protein [Planktotalea sp.]|uniref:class I adenylate-forming enzyme family protein n=1 Tax=Planktotalea sp. TaxID=2029877 RepID=UPI003C72C659